MSNLPVEWREQLSAFPEADIRRLENLLERGITSPLSEDKENGVFVLFVMGKSVEEIAIMTGTPKDVMTLTYLKYRWAEKKTTLMAAGIDKLLEGMMKNMANLMLSATNKYLTEQVIGVMSGQIPFEKCTFLPRSPHGVQQLMDMVRNVNKMDAAVNGNSGNTIIQANQVQVNQQIEAPKNEVIRIPREDRLAKLAQGKE